MQTRIREVRRAKGMSLQDVADRCQPRTTPQTIGRLETGMRTVSVAWLNRIAAALGTDASDLVRLAEQADVPIAAVLDHDGAHAPRQSSVAVPPRTGEGMVAIAVAASVGDYRSGDEIWCRRMEPDSYVGALNRDVLFPRPGDRFIFGRLIGREDGKLQLLPLGAGHRQLVISDPPWAAVAERLIRRL